MGQLISKIRELKKQYQNNIRMNLFGERDSFMNLGTTISFILCLIVGSWGIAYLVYLLNFMQTQAKDVY